MDNATDFNRRGFNLVVIGEHMHAIIAKGIGDDNYKDEQKEEYIEENSFIVHEIIKLAIECATHELSGSERVKMINALLDMDLCWSY